MTEYINCFNGKTYSYNYVRRIMRVLKVKSRIRQKKSNYKKVKPEQVTMTDKKRIIDDTKDVIAFLSDVTEIEKRISDANTEIEIVAELVEKLVQENASKILDQDDYETKYQALTNRYDRAKAELEKANDELLLKKARQKNLGAIVAKMEELNTVLPDGLMRFG